MRKTRVLARIALFALMATSGSIAMAQTTGTIVGTIQDAQNGNPVSGALVVAQSPALQGEQTALTGTEGTFRISLLPPGDYTITVQADGYRPTERPGIRVDLDKTVRVTMQLVPEALKAKEVVVTTEAPVIDQGSTTSGAVIPENFARNVPTGRSFDAVLNVAPGATSDGLGTTFRGSSSPENNWIIDGINTTEIVNGDGSTLLPNDFVKQVEVKTGGYQAEYGRATGGVVNVVTKSGGNEFSGDVYVNFTSGALALSQRSVGSVTSVISSSTQEALGLDFGFDLGGYIIKDKLWFFVGVTPEINQTDYNRTVRPMLLNADGSEILDADGNPTFGDPIASLNRTFHSSSTVLTRIAKLTYNVNENNTATVSYLGNPTTASGIFRSALNGTESFNSEDAESGAQDVAARWTSKLFDKNMLLEAWYGMHEQNDNELPIETPPATAPLDEKYAVVHYYNYLPAEFANVSGCEDVVPGDDTTSPCASYQYGTGPLFFQQKNYSIRHTGNLKLTNFVHALGEHAIKYGADLEYVRYLNRRGYVNDWAYRAYLGRSYGYRRQAMGTVNPDTGVFEPDPFLTSDTHNINTSAFLQDSYQPIDGLTINAGVRWEGQSGYGLNASKPAISINDNWAPRVGVTYDWTGRGRSKIEASFGRYFEEVPMDINSRAYAGEAFGFQWIAPDGVTNLTPNFYGVDTYVSGGEPSFIIPNLRGQFVDEYSGGVQYEVLPDLAVGVTLVHRNIGRVIEDVSPDGGQTYIIANPGDQGAVDASVKTLEKQLTDAGGQILGDNQYDCSGAADPTSCDTIVYNIGLTRGVADFPKPIRDYNAIEMMARKNFSNNWYLIGSLTLSRTTGNYPGLYNPGNGQLDANITSQYDLPELLDNRLGPLYNDRPVYFKLDGYYLWDFGLVTGASFRAYSGRPINALGADFNYGPDEAYLLPAGSGGRLDPLFNLDVNVAYDWMVTEDIKVNFNVNVFNLLNLQQTANVSNTYTYSTVRPVVGGTFDDIETVENGVHTPTILDTDGLPVEYNKNYRQPLAPSQIQAPLTLRLGVRVSF